jgi:dienelactone hydrolase
MPAKHPVLAIKLRRSARRFVGPPVRTPANTFPSADILTPGPSTRNRVPSAAVHARMHLRGQLGDNLTLWLTDLSIFPQSEPPSPRLDDLDREGPFPVGSIDETVEVVSRNRNAKVRFYYPQSGGGVAEGRFPVIVFHHGAANTSGAQGSPYNTVYLRYAPLLERWASYGFVVATIDGVELIRGTSSNLMNLTAMSENQRATIEYLKRRSADPEWALGNHLDTERIVAAGHSRGGGASMITTAANPDVMAAILLKPLDPFITAGGESQWSGKLPARPMLLNIAGDDGDVTYPICDFIFERRASVQAAHTIVGTVHNFTLGCSDQRACGPERRPRITREEDWAITNAYTVAFLKYVVQGDLDYGSLLFGQPGLSTALSPLGVLARGDRGAAALKVDDFQDDDRARNQLGRPAAGKGFVMDLDEPSMASVIARMSAGSRLRSLYGRMANLAHSRAHKLVWNAAGATYRTELGALDVRGRGAFVLRGRSDGTALPSDALTITFIDSAGRRAILGGAAHLGRNGLGARFSDLIVPLTAIDAAGADTAALDAIEIRFDAGAGNVLIDDLRFE